MTTTIYQKFISRYAETFTLVEIEMGSGYTMMEIVPAHNVAKMSEEDVEQLTAELLDSNNEKASWSDDEDEFDEEDTRSSYHQKWDEINSAMDNAGM